MAIRYNFHCHHQTKCIFSFQDKKLDGLRRVKLESAVTHFWRYTMMQSVVYLIYAIYFNVRNLLQTNI